APRAVQDMREVVRRMVASLPPMHRVLDVACGPASYLEAAGLAPVGVDVMESYLREYAARGRHAVRAGADVLPFADASFDGVWTFALLHHLPDAMARQTIAEMRRVCRPGGVVVIVDGVYPERAWRHPFAQAVRAADRGEHMRSAADLIDLLPPGDWRHERFSVA